MTLELTKLSETASTITLGWTPVPGARGYLFRREGEPKISHTLDPLRSSVKFAKGSEWYEVQALMEGVVGRWPPEAPSIVLPGTRATLEVGQIAAWAVHDSPSTHIAPGGARDKHRLISTSGTTYMLFGIRVLEGFPGRCIDAHSTPAFGGSWTPPPYGTGVSPFAIDFNDNSRGLHYIAEAEQYRGRQSHFTIMPRDEAIAKRGEMIWLWSKTEWSKAPAGNGSQTLWVAGEDTPRVNATGLATCYQEDWLSLWEGAYISSGARTRSVVEIAAARVGRTPRECFEDRPVVFVREPAGSPGGTAVATADVDGGSVPVPSALRW